MSTIALSSGLSFWNEFDGNADVRHVVRRVEFLVDGQPLSQVLSEAGDTVPPESHVTVFEVDPARATEVLQGQHLFEEWIPDPDRVPILLCPCGDLLCGALTTQLATDKTVVRWSNWAWDNYGDDPREGMPAMPTFEFDAAEYERAMAEAARNAREGGETLTRVQVALPRHSWRSPLKFGFERTDPRAMLKRLDVELLESRLDKSAEAAFLELLTRLRWARDAIPHAASGGAGPASWREADEVTRVLSGIADSPHGLFLPSSTLESVQWHLQRVKGSS